MRRFFLMLPLLLAIGNHSYAQDARIIKLPELEKLLNPVSDTTYVINFWATWCKPCIKELPYFDALEETFTGSRIKVILISLDFRRQYESLLLPYISKHKIKSEVLLIDEPDYNSWIDKVDPSWSGAIPATLVINKSTGTHKFYEREFTRDEINETVKSLLP